VTDHTLGRLIRIDPRTNKITGRLKLSGADWATPAAGSLWVSQETNVVARVDPRTMKVLKVVKVQANPLGSAVIGGELWVPCLDGNAIVVIDPASGAVVDTIGSLTGPTVVAPDGDHAWVTQSSTELVRF
jgi:DNA-binding beta-propeller fold protein YncE